MADPTAADLVATSYDAFVTVLRGVDDETSWNSTGCRGWAVRDLTQHCLGDAQRALVALHSPTDQEPDRDAVSYWRGWGSDREADANGRRHTRVAASMFRDWEPLRGLHAETALAVVDAAEGPRRDQPVRTQGHVLRVDDLLSTLTVEATIHHLDLVTYLPEAAGPTADGLREVRRVIDSLLGGPAATTWSDERYARVATGRADPTDDEAEDLGALRDRLPVFA